MILYLKAKSFYPALIQTQGDAFWKTVFLLKQRDGI
jgi:hypothetical protein